MDEIDNAASSTAPIDNADSSPEELDESLEEVEESEEEPEETEADEQQLSQNAQKRFDALSEQLREKDRKLAALEAAQSIEYDDPGAPKRTDYEDDEEGDLAYATELAAYNATKNVINTLQTSQERAKAEQAIQATQQKFNVHAERVTTAREKIKDYDEVIAKSHLQVTDESGNLLPQTQAILDCPNSPDVCYHLGVNPELAERINASTPLNAAVMIGRLSAELASANSVEFKPKPDPIESEDTGAGLGKLDDNLPHIKGASFS